MHRVIDSTLIEELAEYIGRHPADRSLSLVERIHTLTGGELTLPELDAVTRQVEVRLDRQPR